MTAQETVIAWAEKQPPREHFVMASYGVMEAPRLFRTCRRGCCVDDGICGPMVLPRYWRDATESERAMWPTGRPSKIDVTAFYDYS